MQRYHDELRDELVAILGASRELPADTDAQLAEAFVGFLEQRQSPDIRAQIPLESSHQPHYSLKLAGAAWGAALMFLFLLLVLDNPDPVAFIVVSGLLLACVAAVTRTFLYMARYGWRAPHVQVTITPPEQKTQGRG